MSVIIRLQGLSWSASAMNIRHFFSGLSIPAGGVHIIGGEGGDAFIAFSSDDDARMAMKKNMCCLNDTPIQLFLSSKAEMQSVIDAARSGVSSSAATPASQTAPETALNTSAAMSGGLQQQQQQQQQRPNFPYNMPVPGMDMQNKNNMQQGSDFASQGQQNPWQGGQNVHGMGGSGDVSQGMNQPSQHQMMGQPPPGMGGYAGGGDYNMFTKGGDHQTGGRGYTQQQEMGAGGAMMNQQGRRLNQGQMGDQVPRGGPTNQGQNAMGGLMDQSHMAAHMSQQGPMAAGNMPPQGAMGDHMNQQNFNQQQMGGPRPMGMNQGERASSLHGDMSRPPPFHNMGMEQSQGGFSAMAGRQNIEDETSRMNRSNPPYNRGMGPESGIGMSMQPGNESRASGNMAMMQEYGNEKAEMPWAGNSNQNARNEQMNKNLFPGDVNLSRANEVKQNQNDYMSHDTTNKPLHGQSGMYGLNRRPGMQQNTFTGDKMDDNTMPSTSYPPDDPSMDHESDDRMQNRFSGMHGYSRDDNTQMYGHRFPRSDQFESDRDRFGGYDRQFPNADSAQRKFQGEGGRFPPDAEQRQGSYGPGGDRGPLGRDEHPEDRSRVRYSNSGFQPEDFRYREREEELRRREVFERGQRNDPWDRRPGPPDMGEGRGRFPPERSAGDRRDFRSAAEGLDNAWGAKGGREPGRRGPSRWDTATDSVAPETTEAVKPPQAVSRIKPGENVPVEAIADKDQRTRSVEITKGDNLVKKDATTKPEMTADAKPSGLDSSRAGSVGKSGSSSQERGSVERKDQIMFEGRDGFDMRGPGFDGRGPRLEGRRPEFEERGLAFEGRHSQLERRGFDDRGLGFQGLKPGFEGRGPEFEGMSHELKGRRPGLEGGESEIDNVGPGVEGRRPMFEGREPGFEGRGPEFNRRDPEMEGRGPGIEGRGPGFEGRGPGFEGRGPGFEGRGPGFEGRGPGFEGRGPGFEGRGPGFEGRGPGFEGRGPGFEGRGPGFEGRGPGFEGRGPGFEGRGPEFEGRGSGVQGRGPEFEGRGPGFQGRGPEFEGRGPGFEGRGPEFEGRGPGYQRRGPPSEIEGGRGEMAFERMEGTDFKDREGGFSNRGRPGFDRRSTGFDGRQTRYDMEGQAENRMGPSFEGRGSRFEGRGPGFEERRGPGFESSHESDMDRRMEEPDFDGRESEGNRMSGQGYGRGGPGMRGRGSDGIRGRGGPGMEMMSRGRGFADKPFDFGRGRPLNVPYGEENVEDFDNRISGRGGPMFDRPFRGRGDFFRGRGGPPGPFGRGRGMDTDRFDDAEMLDVDARNMGERPDGPPVPNPPKGLLGDAPNMAQSSEERTTSRREDGDERRRDRGRSDSASRRDTDNRGIRGSYDRDRERDRDRRYDDRRGRERDDRRYDDRSRYRFVRDRFRRSRSRSRDRSRDRDRHTSAAKSGSPRTRSEAHSRSLCIKNMPLTVNYKEVRRFLQPLDVPYDGLKIINDDKGQRIGVAFVKLHDSDDIPRALRRSGEKMGSSVISISTCTDEEFAKAVDSFVPPKKDNPTAPSSDSKPLPSQTKDKDLKSEKIRYIGQLRNLPQSITKQDIVQFFKGVVIDGSGESVYIEFDMSGVATGTGFVEFKSNVDYEKALTFNGSKIGANAVKVLPGKAEEADDLKGKQTEMLQRAALRNARVLKPGGPQAQSPQSRPGLMGPIPPMPLPQQKATGPVGSSNQARFQAPAQAPGGVRPPAPQQLLQSPGKSQSQPPQQQAAQASSPAKAQGDGKKAVDTVCVHIQGLPLLATPQDIRLFFGESQIAQRGINIAHDSRGKPLGEGFVEFWSKADFEKALKKDKTSLGRHIVAVKPISKPEMLERLGLPPQAVQPQQRRAEDTKKEQTEGQGMLPTPGSQNSAQPQNLPPGPQNGAQQQQRAPQQQQQQQQQQRPKPLMAAPVAGKGSEMPSVVGPGATNKGIPPGVLNQNWFYVRCQNFPPDISIAEILHFFQGFRPLGHSIRLHYSSDGTPTGNAVVGFGSREEAERALNSLNMQRCRQNAVALFPA